VKVDEPAVPPVEVAVAVGVGTAVWVGVGDAVPGVGAGEALWQEAEPLSANEPVACSKLQS
jgi:hypothetical protein